MHRLLVFIFLSLFVKSATFVAPDITGVWLNKDKDAHIQIYESGGKYMGKIIWLQTPNDPETGQPKLDKKNPKENLRSRPVLNLLIMANLEWVAADSKWENGIIYDPKSGNKYSLECSLSDMNNMELRGYLGFSVIGRTDIWTRVIQ